MQPLTYSRPKVMLPIANKPVLEHLLLSASRAGIKEFIIVVGYRDDQVRQYFEGGERWQVKIDYVAQRSQLGTADALRMVEALVDGDFLVMNGDVFFRHEDIKNLCQRSKDTISTIQVKNAEGLGVLEVKDGKVISIQEKAKKPCSYLANAGLYRFTPGIFEAISQTSRSPRGEYEITDSLQLMIDEGHNIYCQEIDYWLNISYPWDLLSANELLLKEIKPLNLGKVEGNVVIKGDVSIGKTSTVRSGSYIIGPVVIGENCEVGPNCYIRPFSSIGDNCHVGLASEVKNSIIMKGSKLPHHNYVGDSVVGEACNLGSGTKIANLRLDRKNVKALNNIDTGRRKLGAIIGDGVQTGINACINTGSMIGNDTHIGPGALASGVISPGSRIF